MASEMNIELRQISASASEATMGKHVVPIDRPDAKGGGDAGPLGGELFLAAVGGCFMSNLLAAINARNADIRDVGGGGRRSAGRFSRPLCGSRIAVAAESADGELLEKLGEIADRGCIMMNTLRGKLEVRVLIGATF